MTYYHSTWCIPVRIVENYDLNYNLYPSCLKQRLWVKQHLLDFIAALVAYCVEVAQSDLRFFVCYVYDVYTVRTKNIRTKKFFIKKIAFFL